MPGSDWEQMERARGMFEAVEGEVSREDTARERYIQDRITELSGEIRELERHLVPDTFVNSMEDQRRQMIEELRAQHMTHATTNVNLAQHTFGEFVQAVRNEPEKELSEEDSYIDRLGVDND